MKSKGEVIAMVGALKEMRGKLKASSNQLAFPTSIAGPVGVELTMTGSLPFTSSDKLDELWAPGLWRGSQRSKRSLARNSFPPLVA